MRQKLGNGYRQLGELGQVLPHGVVEVERPFVSEAHNAHRHESFRYRPDPVLRRLRSRSGRTEAEGAPRPRPHQAAVTRQAGNKAGEAALALFLRQALLQLPEQLLVERPCFPWSPLDPGPCWRHVDLLSPTGRGRAWFHKRLEPVTPTSIASRQIAFQIKRRAWPWRASLRGTGAAGRWHARDRRRWHARAAVVPRRLLSPCHGTGHRLFTQPRWHSERDRSRRLVAPTASSAARRGPGANPPLDDLLAKCEEPLMEPRKGGRPS